jgi:Holliday junction DNA helicase RuvB
LNEEAESLSELVEPFLLKMGLLIRTPAGRRATVAAYHHLGLPHRATPEAQAS